MWQETVRLWSEVFVNAATGVGIIGAGVWAYYRFVRQRDRFPKAALEHHVTFHRLSGSRMLLRVGLVVQNVGSVLLKWSEGGIWVQQVAPCSSHVVDWIESELSPPRSTEGHWPVIAKRSLTDHRQEMEPNETDSTYFDFLIPANVETVLVYSFINNPTKIGIAWNHTTMHRVNCAEGEGQMVENQERQGPPKVTPKPPPSVPPIHVPQPTTIPMPTPQGPPKAPPPAPPPEPKNTR